ncbi:hypothetical protein FRB90_006896, partial [Tulasnella sp. 427]
MTLYVYRKASWPSAPWLAVIALGHEEIGTFLLLAAPHYLPSPGTPFIGGESPVEDDFHFIVWLARIVLLTGGAPDEDGVLTLRKELREDVPEGL